MKIDRWILVAIAVLGLIWLFDAIRANFEENDRSSGVRVVRQMDLMMDTCYMWRTPQGIVLSHDELSSKDTLLPQALTNLVKNSLQALEGVKREGCISVRTGFRDNRISLSVNVLHD